MYTKTVHTAIVHTARAPCAVGGSGDDVEEAEGLVWDGELALRSQTQLALSRLK